MASSNNGRQLKAEPSKPREINNHFQRSNREVFSKRKKGESRGKGPPWSDGDQSYGQIPRPTPS